MALQQTSKIARTLESLPQEMLLQIAEFTHSFADLASLAKTNKRLYCMLNPLLYKLDVRSGSSCALPWACQFGRLGTLKLVHQAGAPLNQIWASKKPLRELPSNPYRHSPEFYQRVARRLKDNKDNGVEIQDDGCLEPSDVDLEGFTHDWEQDLVDQVTKEAVEEEQSDEESDTERVVDEGPCEEPYELEEEDPDSEDHFWPEDKDEAGQPLLKMASQDSRYTWRNDFFSVNRRPLKTEDDPLSGQPRRHPLFWWHPIDLAVYFGHKNIIRYLVANGIKVQHGMSRGLCRQRDISFTCPGGGCDHHTLPLTTPGRLGHADFKFFVHTLLGLVACNETGQCRDMYQFLREIHGWSRVQMRFAGVMAWLG